MLTSTLTVGLSCLALVSAAPFSFPLGSGFPVIAQPSVELTDIEETAHGSLPVAAPSTTAPTPPHDDTLTSLKFIAFNELTEVAFFTELINNITNRAPGYTFDNPEIKSEVLNILNTVQAQEELHALNANNAVTKFAGGPIQPCQYNFPVEDFDSAIALAATFTDVVLGTLQDVSVRMGLAGDSPLIRGVASVLGQEGEQNGLYRLLEGLVPSSLPFLTASTREFAFSALNQLFVVPNTCANLTDINLPIFPPLSVLSTDLQSVAQTLKYTFTMPSGMTYEGSNSTAVSKLSLVLINQQNVPFVQPLGNPVVSGSVVNFDGYFPYNGTTFGNGLTIAVVTNSAGPFASVDDVAAATVYGPGIIELN